MADTLTLETALTHVTQTCGRVCLIGDDQQLGAVGAGGILKDLDRTHPAVRLTQLHRFDDPAEAAATLQIRDGNPAALDFYTGHDRITTADPSSLLDRVVAAWHHDPQAGLDSMMLAGQRSQVANLNALARTARLAGQTLTREVALADGNRGSVGDLIITRRNDRRLGTGPNGPSWVRNGDRWTITALTEQGDINATHRRTGHTAVLPVGYVREAVELGYATTIHAAQGVTVDTSHSLLNLAMRREELYTMISRGRTANQLYVPNFSRYTVDPRHVLHADTVDHTSMEFLRLIVSRPDRAASATSTRKAYGDPASPDREHWRHQPTPARPHITAPRR